MQAGREEGGAAGSEVVVIRVPAVVRWLAVDLINGARHLYLNVFAGSPLVPRHVRWALYRGAGLGMRTMNVFPSLVVTGPAWGRGTLSVGDRTFINTRCRINLNGDVTIGRDCLVASDVLIETATHETVDGRVQTRESARPVVIHDRVWVGAQAIVLPGSIIEPDVVIAAGAVVRGRLTSGGIYGGVPVRRIGDLDPARHV